MDSDASDEAIELRRAIGFLELSEGRLVEARRTLEPLHDDMCVVYGPDDEDTAEIARPWRESGSPWTVPTGKHRRLDGHEPPGLRHLDVIVLADVSRLRACILLCAPVLHQRSTWRI
ncbi:hypothetical protein [Streptomyces sp. NPDC001792]|uniref:hypothetical protein n=1 Tax=unclassified Streptomyces TaxID=2593676 RepID=UPI003316D50F